MAAVLDRNEIPELDGTLDAYGISEMMWELWLKCWDRDVNERPTAAGVLECIPEV
jgi:hypothetical protein